jgi:hypothetical protein
MSWCGYECELWLILRQEQDDNPHYLNFHLSRGSKFLKVSVSIYDPTYCQNQENFYFNNAYCESFKNL